MENKETDIKGLLAQRRIVKTLVGNGFKFTITYTTKERQKGLIGFFKPKVNVEHKEEFVLQEPTFDVLDRVSEVWLRMDTSDIEKKGADTIKEGYKFANKHAKDMAECMAILVLGEAYNAVPGGDNEEIARLKELFYKTMKPSQSEEIAMFINTTNNLVGFVNSTRLMKMLTTTAPTARVE